MQKSTHTPGPFPLKSIQYKDHFVIITNHESHFAKTFDPHAAKLIAAAPEMLDALQAVSDYLGGQDSILADQVNAAIRKTRGEA